MPKSIKLADDVMAVVRKESSLQSRSVAGQATHWINIGRAIEQSGAFDFRRINDALQGLRSPDELSLEEQEVWFAQFTDRMAEPSEEETAFHGKRRKLGRGVGLSVTGELIYQNPQTK